MSLSKSLTAIAVLGAAASAASAAVIPSWRVNPITSPLVPAGAVSVSLMVELTGGSLFNVAGLDLTNVLPSAQYYNQVPFGSDTKPSPALIAVFPDLAFDSYVGTTTDQAPAVPGRLVGVGAAQVGTGGAFNVAWGATPNTGGGTGLLEIARITFLASSGLIDGPLTPVPLASGRVRDSLNPNQDVGLPPIPIGLVPEPMSFAIAGLGLLALRRK